MKCMFSLDHVWFAWAFMVARKRGQLKGLKLCGVGLDIAVKWVDGTRTRKGIRIKAEVGPATFSTFLSQVICFSLDSFPLSTSVLHILHDFDLHMPFWLVCLVPRCTHFPLLFSVLWGLTDIRTPIMAGFPSCLANEWVTRGQQESEKLGCFFLISHSTSHLSKATAPAVGPSAFLALLSSSNYFCLLSLQGKSSDGFCYYSVWPYHPLFILLTLPALLQIGLD